MHAVTKLIHDHTFPNFSMYSVYFMYLLLLLSKSYMTLMVLRRNLHF